MGISSKDVEEILGVDGHDLEGVRLGEVQLGKDIFIGSLIDLERLLLFWPSGKLHFTY
jgi:hypothetical protein